MKNRRINRKVYKIIAILEFIIIIMMMANLFSKDFISQANEDDIEGNIQNQNIESVKVLIDPGHGGSDVGTSNPRTGTIEKGITLKIGNMVVEELEKYSNIEVVTTRTDDTFVSLDDRNKIESDNNCDLFVSIHCNATPDGKSNADGVETFYWREDGEQSKMLAQKVHESITSNLSVRDRGIKRENYQVLRNSKSPSILIETGFLTSNEEEKRLLDEDYQAQLAKYIADGIIKYIEESTN